LSPQAGLAGGAIGWAGYQLLAKLHKLVKKENKSLLSKAAVKEVVIFLGGSTISFLTGGIADAAPNPFEFAQGVSALLSEGTQFGTADGANMYGNDPQNLNLGTVSDAVLTLRDLVECCKVKSRWSGVTCTCTSTDSKGNQVTATMDVNDRTNDIPTEKPAETNDVQSLDLTSGSVMVDGHQMGFTLPGTATETHEF